MTVFATITLPNGAVISSIDIDGEQDVTAFRNMFRQGVRGDTHSISFQKRDVTGMSTMVTIPYQLLKMSLIEITEVQ